MAKKKERAPFQATFRAPDGITYTIKVDGYDIHLAVVDKEGPILYKVVELKKLELEKEPEKLELEKEPKKSKKEGK